MPRFKQRFSLVVPPTGNDLGILDAMKVADTALFLVSAAADELLMDKWGENILSAVVSQVQIKR